jgi:hypothetical protein
VIAANVRRSSSPITNLTLTGHSAAPLKSFLPDGEKSGEPAVLKACQRDGQNPRAMFIKGTNRRSMVRPCATYSTKGCERNCAASQDRPRLHLFVKLRITMHFLVRRLNTGADLVVPTFTR